MKKNNFRWLDNAVLHVMNPEGEHSRNITFGCWDTALKIMQCQDSEYVDIYFPNDDVIFGVHKDTIEQHGIDIEPFVVNDVIEESHIEDTDVEKKDIFEFRADQEWPE